MFNDKLGNAFHTYSAYSAVQTAAKLVGTNTAYKMNITDVMLYANTVGAITLLENTTTTIFSNTPTFTGSTQHFHFGTPIEIAANSALHITTAMTVSSVFICGFWK